jgi:PAS domain S-box-containing protein
MTRNTKRLKAGIQRLLNDVSAIHDFLDKMNIGFWVIDIDGYIVRANRSLSKMLDQSVENIENQHLSLFLEPVYCELLSYKISHSMQHSLLPGEMHLCKKDGSRIPVLVSAFPFYDDDASLMGTAALIEDNTEQKNQLERMTSAIEKYRSLINNLTLGIIRTAPEFIIEINPAVEKITGYSRNELIGCNPDKLFVDVNERRSNLKELISKGHVIKEQHWRKKNGDEIMVLTRATLDKDYKTGDIRIDAIVEDVTELRHIEKALRREKELLESIIASSVDGIFAFDSNCNLTLWNQGMEKITGLKKSQVLGKNAFNAMPFLIEIGEDEYFYSALQGKALIAKDRQYELTETQRKGYFESRYAPLYTEFRAIIGGLAIVREITDSKFKEIRLVKYKEKLKSLTVELYKAAENERRRLAVDLHDQMGNRLAFMRMELVNMLQLMDDDNNTEALQKLIRTTDDLMNEARSMVFQMGSPILYEVGLEAALENTALNFQQNYGINVSFKDDNKVKSLSPEKRVILFQCTNELLTNVVKHAKANNVILTVRMEDNNLFISVEDDGIGFEIEELGISINSGFGIFSVRERLESIGGSLSIHSTLGQGSSFIILVPL